jgi:hypothetical protein
MVLSVGNRLFRWASSTTKGRRSKTDAVNMKACALFLLLLISCSVATQGRSAEILLPEHGCRTPEERKQFAIKLFDYFEKMDVSIPALTEGEADWYHKEGKRLDDRLNAEAGTKKYIADWSAFDDSRVRFLMESKKLVYDLSRSIKRVVDEEDGIAQIELWIVFANELVYSQQKWVFLKGVSHKDKRVRLDWHLTFDGTGDVGEPDRYLLLAVHNSVLRPYIRGEKGSLPLPTK